MNLNKFKDEIRLIADSLEISSHPDQAWEKLALIASEVGEAINAYRKNNRGYHKDSLECELMDIVIRVFHLMSILEIDAQKAFDSIKKNSLENPRWNKKNYPNETFSLKNP